MGNAVNWLLIIAGTICLIAEVAMGVATGFDLALIGISLAAGGAVGLIFDSVRLGFLSAAAFAIFYWLFLRRHVKSRITGTAKTSNVDAVIGQSGIVVAAVAPHGAGQVRVGDEVWRAVLAEGVQETIEPGRSVVVQSIEGVTLRVR
jgi:membrane protein implicated in regulation of membrane protease activity